jgi:trypsin
MRRTPRFAVLSALAAIALLVPATASAQGKGAPQPKIVGGSETTIAQYPWQAAVVDTGSGNAHQRQFCGGSLLTSRIVITAAHCVIGAAPGDVDVVLGRTTLSDTSQGAEVGVIGVAHRSNYDDDYQGEGVPRFDVGYLVLNAPSSQPQIHIAGADERALWAPGDPVEISGWGCTSEPIIFTCSTSDTLRAASVNVVSDGTCSADYGPGFDAATMVCAAAPGKDTCNGASGGPLQAPIGGGLYRLVGITSWGDGCARPNAPGVYTRVADTTLKPLIEADVSMLELQFGLEPESGGSSTRSSTKSSKHPFAKCKRIHNKKKRQRCTKKVREKLQRNQG